MTTPGVVVESTADTPVMLEPLLTRVTLNELHSLRSMTPFPLPPETAVELTDGLGALGVLGPSLVPTVFCAVFWSRFEVVHRIPMPEVSLLQPAGSVGAFTRSKISAKKGVVTTEESRMELPTLLYRDKPFFSGELPVTLVAFALFVDNKSKIGRSKEISAIRRSRVRLFISFLQEPGMDNGSSGKEQRGFYWDLNSSLSSHFATQWGSIHRLPASLRDRRVRSARSHCRVPKCDHLLQVCLMVLPD